MEMTYRSCRALLNVWCLDSVDHRTKNDVIFFGEWQRIFNQTVFFFAVLLLILPGSTRKLCIGLYVYAYGISWCHFCDLFLLGVFSPTKHDIPRILQEKPKHPWLLPTQMSPFAWPSCITEALRIRRYTWEIVSTVLVVFPKNPSNME